MSKRDQLRKKLAECTKLIEGLVEHADEPYDWPENRLARSVLRSEEFLTLTAAVDAVAQIKARGLGPMCTGKS